MSAPGNALIVGVGAANGLGAATARVFAAAGFDVTIAGRNASKLEEALKSITAVTRAGSDTESTVDGGRKGARAPRVAIGDVTRAEDVARFVSVASEAGPITVAVHNAGGNSPAPFLEVTPAVFEQHWREHALGGFLLAQAVLPKMLEQGAGTLIFTGATGSVRGSARFSPFAAAKGALRNLAQSVAREFGPKGIHVAHVIIDGVIHGDRAHAQMPELESRFGPDGMLEPDHIAENYLTLHRQHRSAWTHELDLRPWSEKF
jgi:NAD(P)-dependent dehydrogenase (short-subunit alcohol dehydrogenase family)